MSPAQKVKKKISVLRLSGGMNSRQCRPFFIITGINFKVLFPQPDKSICIRNKAFEVVFQVKIYNTFAVCRC